MKNVSQDRLELLRARYFEQIRAKEAEIRLLREKLLLIDEIDAESKNAPPNSALGEKYAGWKLTKAILDAIQNIGGNVGVSATEVRKYISTNGYRHPGKNFPIATVIALNRLAKTQRIGTDKIDGKRLFMAKK